MVQINDIDEKRQIKTSVLMEAPDGTYYKIGKHSNGISMLKVELKSSTSVPDTVRQPHKLKNGQHTYIFPKSKEIVSWKKFQEEYGKSEIVSQIGNKIQDL